MRTIKLTILSLLVHFQGIELVQNEFDVIFERIQVVWFDKKLYDNFEIVTYKYNRSVASYNITMALRMDKPAFKIIYRSFKFSVNEYKLTAIQFKVNGCAVIKLGKYGFNAVKTNSNLTNCIFKEGTYTLYNGYIDSSTFPPHFPDGKWKFQISEKVNKVITVKAELYLSVIYPVKYGRK